MSAKTNFTLLADENDELTEMRCSALEANVAIVYRDGPLDLSALCGNSIIAQEVASITICDCGQ